MKPDRRSFLVSATSASLVVAGCRGAQTAKSEPDEEVTPAEDLMREHGVLRRIVFMYDEAAARLVDGRDAPLDAVASGAKIIRRVIEDYHEKLEEEHLFPRFEKANKLVDLVTVLRRQHQVGRVQTDRILALADGKDRAALAEVLRAFGHMYRPHAAREDTVLFPEIRALVGARSYAELGESFEEKEHAMLGDHGFEHAVEEVARLEQAFGFADLASFG